MRIGQWEKIKSKIINEEKRNGKRVEGAGRRDETEREEKWEMSGMYKGPLRP